MTRTLVSAILLVGCLLAPAAASAAPASATAAENQPNVAAIDSPLQTDRGPAATSPMTRGATSLPGAQPHDAGTLQSLAASPPMAAGFAFAVTRSRAAPTGPAPQPLRLEPSHAFSGGVLRSGRPAPALPAMSIIGRDDAPLRSVELQGVRRAEGWTFEHLYLPTTVIEASALKRPSNARNARSHEPVREWVPRHPALGPGPRERVLDATPPTARHEPSLRVFPKAGPGPKERA